MRIVLKWRDAATEALRSQLLDSSGSEGDDAIELAVAIVSGRRTGMSDHFFRGGGSQPGRAPNLARDFDESHRRLVAHYYSQSNFRGRNVQQAAAHYILNNAGSPSMNSSHIFGEPCSN
jgi:hypothetical protein